MPKNRQDVDRDIKVDEIVGKATEMVAAGSYRGLSVERLARELGVTRATVYWYFPSKDDLFLETVSRAYRARLSAAPAEFDYQAKIIWAVDQLADLGPFTAGLHERARISGPAADLEREFKVQLCHRLRVALAARIPPERIDDAADTVFATVEGLLTRGVEAAERHRILGYLLSQLGS